MKILFKSFKIILVLGITIALALAAILFFFGENPSEYAAFVDKEIEEMEGSIYSTIENELEGINLQVEDSNIQQDANTYSASGKTESKDNEGRGAAESVSVPDPDLERKIRQAYTNAFLELEASAMGMLHDLEEKARVDYETLASKNELTAQAKVDLASTYFKRADVLEERYDSSVEQLLVDLQMQLTRIGYTGPQAADIAGEYRSAYKEEKESERAAMKARIDTVI